MIRTAVIGLTTAGYEHARAYRADSLSTLVAVCDEDPAQAESVAAALAVPSFIALNDLITATKPDLCSVYSPRATRGKVIQALLEAGVNVLSAVPFAETRAEVVALDALARRANLVLAADFHLRFTPAVLKARQWLAEGVVGTPLFINLSLWTKGEESDDPYGLLRDLGAHGTDMMRYFCGEVRRVQCFGTRGTNPPGKGHWSSAQVNMEFEDGTVGNLTTSYDMVPHHPMARCEMAGTKARFVIDNVYEETTLYVHADEERRVITNSIFGGIPRLKETYGRRIYRLLEQMAGGTKQEKIDGGAHEALAAGATMEAAIEALENESVVDVETIERA